MTTLRCGTIYRLTRDVENPRLDRRCKSDCASLPWKSGDEFLARSSLDSEGRFLLEAVTSAATAPFGHPPIGSVVPTHPGYAGLVAALEPVETMAYREARRERDLAADANNKLKDLAWEAIDAIRLSLPSKDPRPTFEDLPDLILSLGRREAGACLDRDQLRRNVIGALALSAAIDSADLQGYIKQVGEILRRLADEEDLRSGDPRGLVGAAVKSVNSLQERSALADALDVALRAAPWSGRSTGDRSSS